MRVVPLLIGALLLLTPALPGQPAQPPTEESSLTDRLRETIERDVTSAPLGELLSWAASLQLSTRGTRAEVEERILEHYGLRRSAPSPPSRSNERGKQETRVVIESASQSDFFTIEEVDQRYLRLTGAVILRMERSDTVHTIRAEEVVINLEKNSLSARGNVEYRVERASGTEYFRGAAVVFQLESWDGVFLGGVTETRLGEATPDQELNFFVEGAVISRSPDEIVVIDGGTITSSVADPPNYRITARRIWILGPGEWGLRDAVLYVGRVPLFYFPYFFLPGDKLFFNPTIGAEPRRGGFIQTTTYLYGQARDTDPALSILRLGQTDDSVRRVREGLFLRIPDEPVPPERPGWTMKLMADMYTTLGYYAGLAASLPGLGPFSRFEGRLGLARSHGVYRSPGTTNFTNYYVENGQVKQRWVTGYFVGEPLPVRYESTLELAARYRSADFFASWTMYSDPRFLIDFHDRREGMDFSDLLEPDATVTKDQPVSISTMVWRFRTAWRPRVPELAPWIDTIALESLSAEMNWARRTTATARLARDIRRFDSDNSPEAEFFYPVTAVFPDMNVRLAGTLWQYPRPQQTLPRPAAAPRPPRVAPAQEAEDEDLPYLRPPWEERPAPPLIDPPTLRVPPPITDLPGVTRPEPWRAGLRYTLEPAIRLERFSDNRLWTAPEDVRWNWWYGSVQSRLRAITTFNAAVFDRFADVSSSLTFEYREPAVIADEPLERRLLEPIYRFGSTTLQHASRAAVFPLRVVPAWSESSIQYSLTNTLYRRRFTTLTTELQPIYEAEFGKWDKDDVTVHRSEARLAVRVLQSIQTLTFSADLPPRLALYRGQLRAVTGPLTSTFQTGYRERADGTFQPEPYIQEHRLAFFSDRLSFDQRFEYDLEQSELQQARSQARVWPLTVQALATRRPQYRYIRGTGWRDTGERDFSWTSLSFVLAATTRDAPLLFPQWANSRGEFELWERRVRIGAFADANLTFDLARFTNSNLTLRYGTTFNIYRFVNLEVSAATRNQLVYQYVEEWAGIIGRPRRDLFQDLLDSLSLSDQVALERSLFKLQEIRLRLIHDLQDWELSATYTGRPELVTRGTVRDYEWRGVLALLVRWRPISELRRNIVIDESVQFGQ